MAEDYVKCHECINLLLNSEYNIIGYLYWFTDFLNYLVAQLINCIFPDSTDLSVNELSLGERLETFTNLLMTSINYTTDIEGEQETLCGNDSETCKSNDRRLEPA